MNIEKKMKRIEASELRTEQLVTNIANQRLRELVSIFKKKRPNKSLQILFGNGSEHVSINGEPFRLRNWDDLDLERESRRKWEPDDDDTPLDEVEAGWIIKALMDVDTLTDGYKRGAPDDVFINQETGNVDQCNTK